MKLLVISIVVLYMIDVGHSTLIPQHLNAEALIAEARRRNIPCGPNVKIGSLGCTGCERIPGTMRWKNKEGTSQDIYSVMQPDVCATGRTTVITVKCCCSK